MFLEQLNLLDFNAILKAKNILSSIEVTETMVDQNFTLLAISTICAHKQFVRDAERFRSFKDGHSNEAFNQSKRAMDTFFDSVEKIHSRSYDSTTSLAQQRINLMFLSNTMDTFVNNIIAQVRTTKIYITNERKHEKKNNCPSLWFPLFVTLCDMFQKSSGRSNANYHVLTLDVKAMETKASDTKIQMKNVTDLLIEKTQITKRKQNKLFLSRIATDRLLEKSRDRMYTALYNEKIFNEMLSSSFALVKSLEKYRYRAIILYRKENNMRFCHNCPEHWNENSPEVVFDPKYFPLPPEFKCLTT